MVTEEKKQMFQVRGAAVLRESASNKKDAEEQLEKLAKEVFQHQGGTFTWVIWDTDPSRRQALVLPEGHPENISIYD